MALFAVSRGAVYDKIEVIFSARERSDRASQTFWLVGRGYLAAEKLSASHCEKPRGHVQNEGRAPGRARSGRRRSRGIAHVALRVLCGNES